MTAKVLVVDDEKLTRATLKVLLRDHGYAVTTVDNGFDALTELEQDDHDIVVTDLRMPSMDGLELLHRIQERWPDIAVIMITAHGTVSTAVDAMRQGAADYLTKPIDAGDLIIRIERLLEYRRTRDEIRQLRAAAAQYRASGNLVYRSGVMQRLVERALTVADSDATVLIQGNTGTGKQVVAQMIHDHSPRAEKPFVAVNCSEMNVNLVESELFGHEAGAFTGATRRRKGRFETAIGGTLFIDEVDDLPKEIQVRLLRFLQERNFERVGSSKTITGDVRVLCATKQDLRELVEAGEFRDDLFYRINTVTISLPPLRERPDDIVPLVEHFARRSRETRGYDGELEIHPDVWQVLTEYEWPGNVRELQNTLEHAVIFARGGPIVTSHLPEQLVAEEPTKLFRLNLQGHTSVPFADVIRDCEQELVDWALEQTGGNQLRAAELLGMSRTTFRSRLAVLRQRAAIQEDSAEGPDTIEVTGSDQIDTEG